MGELFEAAGTLREVYRRVDWAATPLGPVRSWTPTLRAAMDMAFQTRFPVTFMWGPELVMLYNEAYAPMIGAKHPAALGTPAAAVFSEIWDTIGPMLTGVLSGRQATWSEELELLMERHGFLEECFFTFSYSAVRDADGRIEGVIDIASETTGQVVSRRRLTLLARLSDALGGIDDPGEILVRAMDLLSDDTRDLPEVDIRWPGLAYRGGGSVLPALPPSVFEGRNLVTEDVGGRTVLWLRLATASAQRQDPVLVAGLNPHLPVDDAYIRFVRLIGVAIMQAFDREQARQAERRIAELERQMSEALQHSLLTPPAQTDDVRVSVRYQPAAVQMYVGGDWYDSFELPHGGLALAIGDVAGHDRRAAAAMAQLRNLLRGIAVTLHEPPSIVLTALDDAMWTLAVNAFATVVFAHLEKTAQQPTGHRWTLRWSNAGHPPPVLVASDGTVTLLHTPVDVMLGVHAGATRRDHIVTLTPGCTVVLYTDGLVERRGAIIDDGLADLTHTLTGSQHMSVEQLSDHLLARHADTGEDDIALVVLRIPVDVDPHA